MRIDNLNDSGSDRLAERVDALERAAPLRSASVSGGRLVFLGGLLRVDSGGRLEVVGTFRVDGDTVMTGAFTQTGFTSLNGPTEINGATTINGQFWINGLTHLNGEQRLSGDLRVISGGKIVVGDMTIKDGEVTFATGGKLVADPDEAGVKIVGSGTSVYAGSLTAGLTAGDSIVRVTPASATVRADSIILNGGIRSPRSHHPTVAGLGVPAGIAWYSNPGGILHLTDGT